MRQAFPLLPVVLALVGQAGTVSSHHRVVSEANQASQSSVGIVSDPVSVASYGARGDGATDDTGAIQSALTAANGRDVHFPRGIYKISRRLALSSNTRLVADGAVTLKQTTPGEIVFAGRGISNVSIRGFALNGPGSETLPVGGGTTAGAITVEGPGGTIAVEQNVVSGFFNGITGIRLTGFTVRDNEVSAWRLYAVLASQTSDFHIEHNQLHDNDMPPGTEWSGSRIYRRGETATYNKLMWMSVQDGNTNHRPDGGSFWIQIATYGISATGNRPANLLQSRNTISFNRIRNNPMWDGIMTHDCDGLIIGFNDIRDVRNGIELGANTAGYWSDKTVVVGNYLEGTGVDAWRGATANNSGIAMFGLDAASAARNASIADNIVLNFGRHDTGKRLGGGVSLAHASGVTISGNRILGVGPSKSGVGGITLNGTVSQVAITGNALATDGGAKAGILLYNAQISGGITISGNVVVAGDQVPAIGVFATSADAIVITGNALGSSNSSYEAVRSDDATISDLVVSGNSPNDASRYRINTSKVSRHRFDFGGHQ